MTWEITLDELPRFASAFWTVAGDATVFAFHGEMGAGKTTTIAALCAVKAADGPVSSPTFSIINEYGYEEEGRSKKIFHIDLYRLKDDEEVEATGVEDCVTSGAICFVEWPGKAPWLFEADARHVMIAPLSEDRRRIRLLTHNEFTTNSFEEDL
jgi:tRNA threonylcarbamoyladenosine biosynthesis protein TsaE